MRRRILSAGSLLLALLIGLPGPSWAALAFNEAQTVTADSPAGSTVAVAAANVASGSLLVNCYKWESAVTLNSIGGTGGDTFTLLTGQVHSLGEPAVRCGYKLSATANASYVATGTWSGTPSWVKGVLFEFTYSGTASADGEVGSTEDDADLTPSTNTLTTTGTDEACIAALGNYTSDTFSAKTINGVTADGSTDLSDMTMFYKILTATFTNGAASLSRVIQPHRWIARMQCFKTTAGGGPTPRNLMMMGVGQ